MGKVPQKIPLGLEIRYLQGANDNGGLRWLEILVLHAVDAEEKD
jgi:hypothetical protein